MTVAVCKQAYSCRRSWFSQRQGHQASATRARPRPVRVPGDIAATVARRRRVAPIRRYALPINAGSLRAVRSCRFLHTQFLPDLADQCMGREFAKLDRPAKGCRKGRAFLTSRSRDDERRGPRRRSYRPYADRPTVPGRPIATPIPRCFRSPRRPSRDAARRAAQTIPGDPPKIPASPDTCRSNAEHSGCKWC
jgi:hypothetical protein